MTNAQPIECFFDCSSPWTYLGFLGLRDLAQRLDATVHWRPFLVGGVFNAVNPAVYHQRETPDSAKQVYLRKDLADWSRQAGVALHFPPSVFPVNSVKAMRACLWLQHVQGPAFLAFVQAVFEAYWLHDRDISQDAVLADIASTLQIDPAALQDGIAEPSIRQALKDNTAEAIARGAFGSPTFFYGDDMYFGNDRLPLLEAAVRRARSE